MKSCTVSYRIDIRFTSRVPVHLYFFLLLETGHPVRHSVDERVVHSWVFVTLEELSRNILHMFEHYVIGNISTAKRTKMFYVEMLLREYFSCLLSFAVWVWFKSYNNTKFVCFRLVWQSWPRYCPWSDIVASLMCLSWEVATSRVVVCSRRH